MKAQIAASPEAHILRLDGDLDLYHAETAREALLKQLSGSAALELDLSGVEACDTAGIQLLLAARRSAVAAGKPFVIHATAPALATCGERLGVPSELWQSPAK